MRQPKSSSYDLLLAVLLTVVGGASVLAALVGHWDPREMNPGVEGSLTVVALSPVFALLHGLSYRDTVKLCVPILGVEFIVSRLVDAPVFAVMGIALIAVGFLGFLASLRVPATAARRSSHAPRLSTGDRKEATTALG
jgi:hypothetical protein